MKTSTSNAMMSLIVAVALALATPGCDDPASQTCAAGSVEGCSCAAGGVGTRECRGDGAGWMPCDCGEADGDADLDADGDGRNDSDVSDADEGPVGGGPLTRVISDMSVIAERLFDIDGDGELDNAVADLGADNAALFALMLNSILDGASATEARQLIHFPWVEDLGTMTDGDIILINFTGNDLDDPIDLSDDYSGEEPFHARHTTLDACGEPLYYSRDASLTSGALEVTGGSLAVGTQDGRIVVRNAVGRGTLSIGGDSNEIIIGGAMLVRDLGGVRASSISADLNLLEVLLAGGAMLGIEALPGLRPDLDLDGDGLETFVVDETHHVVRCIDGDHTLIEGGECWRDPRIADALSLTLRLTLVGATFSGRQPGWEALVEGECTDPPEESLFDSR